MSPASAPLIAFPAHALLIVEKRLAEQEAQGVEMPEGMERDELALRILIAAAQTRRNPRKYTHSLDGGVT
jgi:hypothetical protein